MNNALSIWESPQPADLLDRYIEEGDNLDLILAQIPALFGDSEKATYLGFRSVGLRPLQAMEILGLPYEVLGMWREQEKFAQFEDNHLIDLQKRVGADIVRLGFLRNMTMFLFKDQLLLRKSMMNMEEMTNREFQYLRTTRRFYSMHDFLALNKAIEPEKHRDNVLHLNFSGNVFEVTENNPEVRLVDTEE